jgi:hypothetical protein
MSSIDNIFFKRELADNSFLMKRRKKMKKRVVTGLACLVLATLVGVALAQQNEPYYPVGSISFETTSIAAGLGASWGNGWMIFQGQQYPISVQGLSVGAVGISKVNAVGNVYNLNNPSDLAGTYVGVSGGIAIAGGVKGTTVQNGNGVVIDLTATQAGVSFNLGAEGFTISMQ